MRMRIWAGVALGAAALAATAAHGAAPAAIFTVAGGGDHGFKGDGKPATSALLNGPAGIAVAPDGAILVADTINQRIRRIDPATQVVRTIAGNGKRGFGGDGGPATAATLQDPTALAVGRDGSVFIADTDNNRVRVVRPNGTIATVAGAADQGFSGDGGPATSAQLNAPAGLAIDAAGRLFVSDTGNNRVRVIEPSGTIVTLAGDGRRGAAGDGGPAPAAQLSGPAGLAVASDGSLLIADAGNNRVRRIALSGLISTVAGTGGGGSAGDGGRATSAELNLPVDVAAIPGGGFFVAEQGGNRVRRVDGSGTITRAAGRGGPRFGGDAGPASRSLVNSPQAVELLPSGAELLIADTDNDRLRYVALAPGPSLLAVAPLKPSVLAPLVKLKRGNHRVLVVRDTKLGLRLTKESDLTLRIRPRHGGPTKTFRTHTPAGARSVHLPARLRSGKHRLTRDHYVVGVTAKSGSAIATSSLELTVR
jgi:sugar lactone lactonase YvrE